MAASASCQCCISAARAFALNTTRLCWPSTVLLPMLSTVGNVQLSLLLLLPVSVQLPSLHLLPVC